MRSHSCGMPHQRSHFTSECFDSGNCLFPSGKKKCNTARSGRHTGSIPSERFFEPVCFPHHSFHTVPNDCGRNVALADSEQDGIVSPEKSGFRHECSVDYRKKIPFCTLSCFEKARCQVFSTQDFILAQGMNVYSCQCLKTSMISACRTGLRQ